MNDVLHEGLCSSCLCYAELGADAYLIIVVVVFLICNPILCKFACVCAAATSACLCTGAVAVAQPHLSCELKYVHISFVVVSLVNAFEWSALTSNVQSTALF